jgi:D-xylulose reductase
VSAFRLSHIATRLTTELSSNTHLYNLSTHKMVSVEKNPSLFLSGPGNAWVGESPYPSITEEHDVIIRIAYVGVCGSDISFWTKGGISAKVDASRPLIMGHEASGTIHEIGSAVSSLRVGDKVAIEPGVPCRRCLPCKAGRYNLCPKMVFAASPPFSHGTLAKYFKIVSHAPTIFEQLLT